MKMLLALVVVFGLNSHADVLAKKDGGPVVARGTHKDTKNHVIYWTLCDGKSQQFIPDTAYTITKGSKDCDKPGTGASSPGGLATANGTTANEGKSRNGDSSKTASKSEKSKVQKSKAAAPAENPPK